MSQRKSILFFINTLRGGGAERVLIDLANNMDDSKYDITIHTLLDIGKFKHQLRGSIKYKSIIKIKNAFLRQLCSYILSFRISPRIVYNLFIKGDYDYEVAFLEGVPTRLIAASSNQKAVKYAWVHTDVSNNYEIGKVYTKKENHISCYKRFDKVICVSEEAQKGFIKTFSELDTLCVKYNVINDIKIKEKADSKVLEDCSDFIVAAIGRFEYVKGFDRLLRVHKRLIEEGLSYKLVLVGDGPLRGEFEDYVQKNSLAHCTEFVGFTENPYPYIKRADMIAIPSRAEGFSTVACESVILGKPIVMTNSGGTIEILGHSESGIVTENDEEAFLAGMKKMILDEKVRMEYAQKALQKGEMFTIKSTISNIQQLFE